MNKQRNKRPHSGMVHYSCRLHRKHTHPMYNTTYTVTLPIVNLINKLVFLPKDHMATFQAIKLTFYLSTLCKNIICAKLHGMMK